MTREILAISGKPGLYKLVSRGYNMLIVEALDSTHKRIPVYAADRVVSVVDISIYTDDGEDTPLVGVFKSLAAIHDTKPVDINPKKAESETITELFKAAVPNYDTDRVRLSDMRKVFAWYNILINADITDFEEPEEPTEESAEPASTEDATTAEPPEA